MARATGSLWPVGSWPAPLLVERMYSSFQSWRRRRAGVSRSLMWVRLSAMVRRSACASRSRIVGSEGDGGGPVGRGAGVADPHRVGEADGGVGVGPVLF